MVSGTKSLIACPPKVLIRWSASWITKTTRMREGISDATVLRTGGGGSGGGGVVVRLKYLGLTVDWPVLKFDGRQCDVASRLICCPDLTC